MTELAQTLDGLDAVLAARNTDTVEWFRGFVGDEGQEIPIGLIITRPEGRKTIHRSLIDYWLAQDPEPLAAVLDRLLQKAQEPA